MSKGSRRRPTGPNYGPNFESIFGKRELKTWKPDEDEREVIGSKVRTDSTMTPDNARVHTDTDRVDIHNLG